MTIRYQCVECDATMKIKDEKAGTTAHCPKCKVEFIVPAATSENTAEAPQAVPQSLPASSEEEREAEFQAILMGSASPHETAGHRRPVDSDTYLTNDADDEPNKTGFAESDTDLPKPAAPPTAKPRGRTTAEISASMMKNTAEPTLKKTGKPFGEGKAEKGSAQAKAAAQARVYYARQIGLGSLVVVVVCYGLYSLMSSMMGGPRLPPLARVTGTVTLDGQPLPGASVLFQPVFDSPTANTHIAGSIGITDKQGHFDLQYVEGVRGAAIGKHLIQIRATNAAGVEIVPAKYNYNTQLGFEVTTASKPADFALLSK